MKHTHTHLAIAWERPCHVLDHANSHTHTHAYTHAHKHTHAHMHTEDKSRAILARDWLYYQMCVCVFVSALCIFSKLKRRNYISEDG